MLDIKYVICIFDVKYGNLNIYDLIWSNGKSNLILNAYFYFLFVLSSLGRWSPACGNHDLITAILSIVESIGKLIIVSEIEK